MIKFASKRYLTQPGSGTRVTYELRFSSKTGALELFEKGVEDFQAIIDSFAESCDLSVIAKRIENGEVDLLSANVGSYGDFSCFPDSYHDLLQIRIDAKNTWNNLTKEQQAKFGDFESFASSAGTEDWFNLLGVEFNSTSTESEDVKDDGN